MKLSHLFCLLILPVTFNSYSATEVEVKEFILSLSGRHSLEPLSSGSASDDALSLFCRELEITPFGPRKNYSIGSTFWSHIPRSYNLLPTKNGRISYRNGSHAYDFFDEVSLVTTDNVSVYTSFVTYIPGGPHIFGPSWRFQGGSKTWIKLEKDALGLKSFTLKTQIRKSRKHGGEWMKTFPKVEHTCVRAN